MASGSKSETQSLKEDLTCAICCDLFRDPVMLGCMHHFCRKCITTYWRSIRGPAVCPQCRHEFPNKQFQTNYLVAGLVEKVRASSSAGSLKHLQKQIKDCLACQKSQKEEIIAMIRKDQEQMEKVRKTGAELQERVRGDFQALHRLLQAEEEAVTDQLKRDQEEIEQSIEGHLTALHAAVRELEQSVSALQSATSTAAISMPVERPELNFRPQAVQAIKEPDVDGFRSKYISPLQYSTWRKMIHSLRPGPLRLTFDEDTVHPNLVLLRDKTVVAETDVRQPYTPNPKRFTQCVNVLAAQGFQTGQHYWEVGVGNKPKWDIGVALETVNRQARVKLCPDNGYWTLRLRNSTQYSAGTQPWTPVPVTSRPFRIGVFLDCEEHTVSFYNTDNMQLLFSFSDGPRGKVYPFFSTCISEPGKQIQPICLLHYPSMTV
ncbi:tripartite motif containing 105 [Trichomycterus rosablanca]|uniref:tripartite motif containing 105 n=1 Tax=Trichomycterus rosablanca TaxID=2290929 RepID=UPI002F358982